MTTTTVTENEPAPWYDRASDWFNAILIKEARQALKSRQFVATFMLLLAVAWVVSVFLLLNSGTALEYGAMGDVFFYCFYAVLAFAAFVIVPFVAFRSLLSERDFSTYDLLSITVLKPRQIVWGKLLSAGLQLFLIYSAITPFIAFASLLQGFNTANSAVLLLGTLFYSLILSMWALMLATFAKNRATQALITVGLFFGLLFAYFSTIGQILAIARFGALSFSDPYFWWSVAFAVVAGASYFALFQQIAESQLTFESDNRSTGIRVVCAGQFWLLWIAFAVFYQVSGLMPTAGLVRVVAVLSVVHWMLAGLVFSTESDALSRRVRRSIPKSWLLRIPLAPFLPGGARGYLLALFHLLALWLIVVFLFGMNGLRPGSMTSGEYFLALFEIQSPAWTPTLRATTAVCYYAAIYLGIAAAIGRWGVAVSSDVRPVHVRIFAVLIGACGAIFPLLLRATEMVKGFDFVIYDITNPVPTVSYLLRKPPTAMFAFDWSSPIDSVKLLVEKRGYLDVILVILAVTACLAVLVNGLALLRGLTRLKPLSLPASLHDPIPTGDGQSV